MRKKTKYDDGECEICGTRMQERLIKRDFWLRGELIIVEGVPAGVCPRCGEKVVKVDVGLLILKLIKNSKRIALNHQEFLSPQLNLMLKKREFK
jgi:YgiT-type zinc finger domain-containing protein